MAEIIETPVDRHRERGVYVNWSTPYVSARWSLDQPKSTHARMLHGSPPPPWPTYSLVPTWLCAHANLPVANPVGRESVHAPYTNVNIVCE